MSESFDFEQVEHFTAGAVGEPGARTFFLQAGAAERLVSLKCEKLQAGALAEYLAGVVADLPPADPPTGSLDLVLPVVAEWIAGTMSVAYDDSADRIVLQIEELVDEAALDPDAGVPDPATLRIRLTRGQVTAYIAHTTALVEAGRPPCELCGHPRGPDHVCPRTNGHGPPH